MSKFTRRDFLRTAGVAGAALAVPGAMRGAMFGATEQSSAGGAAQARGARKRVIVVGAGLAGLVAARELVKNGHEVTILEAQLRPGGRVLTLRSEFSDGLYAEAGAARILSTHDLTIRYARELNLKLVPFYPSSGQFVFQVAGQNVAGPLGGPSQWPVALTAEERRLGRGGMWKRYVFDVAKELGNPAEAGWSPSKFAEYDKVTFVQFLRQRGASAGAIRVMLLGSDFDGASALRILSDIAVNGDVTGEFKIDGGNDRLPRALAAPLSSRIRYGAALESVEQDRRGVRARFLQGNLTHTVEGDRLICTIPFPVLRRVEFTPQLPDEKFYAIQNTYYLSATRVIFQERRRYFAARGRNGFALADWPVEVWQPSFDQPGERALLSGYMTGEMARRVAGLPEDRRLQSVLNEMETLLPGARENFEGGYSKTWDDDFWARGAAQWFRPGQMTDYWAHMATPAGRVHFGGEHTSPWPGWMQGAIHSGLRTAREVEEAGT
ncbi:MAG: FAD-dependent oxidoreductase [Acidobacteriota bacterium]|nr:FAD-dependent oxidoreductase [Acidobacteriota bacterium]